MDNLTEKTLSSKTVFDGKILHVILDEAQLPDGNTASREVVRHVGGVCVAALDEDDCLYFVRQFRYPYNEITLELPAGKLEKGATVLENGKRELKEETGCEGYSYVSLGAMYPSTGYTDEIIHDEDEFLNVERIPLKKAVEMVLNNQLPDAKTQIAILKLHALLNNK